MTGVKRSYGSGSVSRKGNTWQGRWYVNGKQIKRSLGPVREKGSKAGLTRKEAEIELHKRSMEYIPPRDGEPVTFTEVGTLHVNKLRTVGRKRSTIEAYESARLIILTLSSVIAKSRPLRHRMLSGFRPSSCERRVPSQSITGLGSPVRSSTTLSATVGLR